MRVTELYIRNKRVDLFGDEHIKVNSSVQNINDIGKVFTDFSQDFTVPATPRNNAIFEHWYDNSVDTVVLQNEKQEARLQINGRPFRKGVVQLNGVEIKDGQPVHYKCVFFGDNTTLKDLFGNDKLSDLDYSGITHEYTAANVSTAISSTSDLDVRYPLISSSRVWSYGDATGNDISISGNAIDYTELFPALKDSKIIDVIEATYGVTFTGTFSNSGIFKKSFTWFKNRKETNFTNKPERLLFNVGGTTKPLADSVAHVEYTDILTIVPAGSTVISQGNHQVTLFLTPNFTGTYYVDVYMNGGFWVSYEFNGVAGFMDQYVVSGTVPNNNFLDYELSFYARAVQSGTISGYIRHVLQYSYSYLGTSYYGVLQTTTAALSLTTLTTQIDWNSAAPDITVVDWFSGILKEFNLVCVPVENEELTYTLETLETWYASGGKLDITKYVDRASVKFDRLSPYKEINFSWEVSKTVLNIGYESVYKKQYGDLRATFPYDGGKYDIKLPFENLLFQKFDGENLQVSYSLDKDTNPIIPKCVKLFMYSSTTCDFYLNSSGTVNKTSYMPMGQDMYFSSENLSQNFGSEQSSLLGTPIDRSLYRAYYEPYLINLFAPKSRKLSLKAVLSLPKLLNLTLEDEIIFLDKKYRINNMTTNLTTGEVDMVLISDWTKTRSRKGIGRITPATGGTVTEPIKPIKPTKGGYVLLTVSSSPFSTSAPSAPATITEDTILEITVPSYTGTTRRTDTYTLRYYDGEGVLLEEEVFPITQEGDYVYLTTEDGRYILTEDFNEIIT